MTQTPNGENNMVSEEYPLNKTLWSIFVLLVFGVIFSACKKEVIEENAEKENTILPDGDLYPAGIIEE